jgi:hypothetical protein
MTEQEKMPKWLELWQELTHDAKREKKEER